MKTLSFFLLLLTGAACLTSPGCHRSGEPFYMKDVEALRRLPEEDRLRMRDDILDEAAQLPDQLVQDSPPEGPILQQGKLVSKGDRMVAGTVAVRTTSDGSVVICLLDFRVPQAPDLQVEIETAGKFESLGALRGNTGTQVIPRPEPLANNDPTRLRIRAVIFEATVAEADLSP